MRHLRVEVISILRKTCQMLMKLHTSWVLLTQMIKTAGKLPDRIINASR